MALAAVAGEDTTQAADPRARCKAAEFIQPEEIQDTQKWERPLPRPLVAPHDSPGPKAGDRARYDWDGRFPMHQIQPKGWIKVSDIKAASAKKDKKDGCVKNLYDETLTHVVRELDPPICKPDPFDESAATSGSVHERLHHKIAPEFWRVEGGFDPDHFWDIHKAIPYYEVVVGAFDAEILPGLKTPVWGYNRQVPGPTFVEEVNRPLVVRFVNELKAELSVHLHGGHTPSHSDGHPAFLVCPNGEYRDYFYSNGIPKVPTADPLDKKSSWDWSESASTMWYHDHANDITAHNALMGLAGFFLVTDAWERFLVKHHILPAPNYRDPALSRDIPIVLGDRCFCKPQPTSPGLARIHFDPFDHNGYLGSIAVCNGMAFPKLEAKAAKYRFRFLNGALARVHLLELWDAGDVSGMCGPDFDRIFSAPNSGGQRIPDAWDRIGKDSWMLDKPVKDSSVLLGMANRADVVVDFKRLLNGRKKATFFLVNVCDQRNGRGPGHGDNDLARQDGVGTTNQIAPRGDRENVPRLDDPKRLAAFKEEDGGANWGTLKLLRIDVVDDGTADPCVFDRELTNLESLLKRDDIKQEIAADPQLSEQAGVHLRKHDDLMKELTWDQIKRLPHRRFDFERGKGAWRISHRFFDEHRTDAPMVLGSLEVWHLVNRSGGWWHPIHIHLESHQQIVVEFDGKTKRSREDKNHKTFQDYKLDVQPHDKCKHDTALLGPNTEIYLLMRFRTFLGPFVFHCHNLNHEDMRMMTNFDPRLESLGAEVVDPKLPPKKIVVMDKPMIPHDLMLAQIDGKFLPIPAPVPVQQFFGDECE